MTDAFANTLHLIIGGSSGMGLETARLLVNDGASVVIVRQGELDDRSHTRC